MWYGVCGKVYGKVYGKVCGKVYNSKVQMLEG